MMVEGSGRAESKDPTGPLDPLERAPVALDLMARGDEFGLEMLHLGMPRVTVSQLSPLYVDTMEAGERAVSMLAHVLAVHLTERRLMRFAGGLAKQQSEHFLDSLQREREEHDPALKSHHEDMRAEDEKFREEYGAFSWWEQRGIELGHPGLVMQYELATLGIVYAWEGFQRYCTEKLKTDAATTVRAYLIEDGAIDLLASIQDAQDDFDCANDPRWLDAFERHYPIWADVPASTRRSLGDARADQSEERRQMMIAATLLSADQAYDMFCGDQLSGLPNG